LLHYYNKIIKYHFTNLLSELTASRRM